MSYSSLHLGAGRGLEIRVLQSLIYGYSLLLHSHNINPYVSTCPFQFHNYAIRFKGEKTEDLTGYHCNRPLTNLNAQTFGNLHFPPYAHFEYVTNSCQHFKNTINFKESPHPPNLQRVSTLYLFCKKFFRAFP